MWGKISNARRAAGRGTSRSKRPARVVDIPGIHGSVRFRGIAVGAVRGAAVGDMAAVWRRVRRAAAVGGCPGVRDGVPADVVHERIDWRAIAGRSRIVRVHGVLGGAKGGVGVSVGAHIHAAVGARILAAVGARNRCTFTAAGEAVGGKKE